MKSTTLNRRVALPPPPPSFPLLLLLLLLLSILSTHAHQPSTSSTSSSSSMPLSRFGDSLLRGGADKLSPRQTSRSRFGSIRKKPSKKEDLPPPPTNITIAILTWNMAEKSPPMTDVASLAGQGLNTSDLTIIGLQEVENLKPRRHEGSRSREWRRLVLATLGRTHALLSLTKLGGMQLAVLCRKPLVPYLSPLHICEVPCGVGNVLHNKGAQAALFRIGQHTSFLFINAHLAAHAHRVEDRNADVDRIMTELQNLLWFHLRDHAPKNYKNGNTHTHTHTHTRNNGSPPSSPPRALPPHHLRASSPPEALIHKVDRFFFLGDLNYRLELPREDIEIPLRRVKNGKISQADAVERMLEYDQLTIERAKGRVFQGLEEPHLGFLPTFKFNKGRDMYDTSPKKRAPAWTDRILYKPCVGVCGGDSESVTGEESKEEVKKEEEIVVCERYESIPWCRHSDHRPVLGVFRVRLEEGVGVKEEGKGKGKEKEKEVPVYAEDEESDATGVEEERERERAVLGKRKKSSDSLLEAVEEETEEEGSDSGYASDDEESDGEEDEEESDSDYM